MVSLFRSLMLDVKAKSVAELIERYTDFSQANPFRYVITMEQTGDSYLTKTQKKIQSELGPMEK